MENQELIKRKAKIKTNLTYWWLAFAFFVLAIIAVIVGFEIADKSLPSMGTTPLLILSMGFTIPINMLRSELRRLELKENPNLFHKKNIKNSCIWLAISIFLIFAPGIFLIIFKDNSTVLRYTWPVIFLPSAFMLLGIFFIVQIIKSKMSLRQISTQETSGLTQENTSFKKEKLAELEKLFKDGTITEKEYHDARTKVIQAN